MEPTSVGDIKKQVFTHFLLGAYLQYSYHVYWQWNSTEDKRKNKVEEVKKNEIGNALVLLLMLAKWLLLKLEDGGKISMRVTYEKLPEFCFVVD